MEKSRSSFSGRIGFVLAAAGSAVGLGNIWRFPYLAAKYGGGIFLLVYVILAITFGFSLMIAEIALGRKTGLSAVGAYRALNRKYSFIGTLTSVVPMIILPYYCVIGSWVVKYFAAFLSGQGNAAAGETYFANFTAQTAQPIVWFCVYAIATAVVVLLGVEKGVEKVSKILMPFLVVLSIAVAAYTVCMPGAIEGVKYYLFPDFSKFSTTTVLAALGQLFYSMSLAMGIMITYGSYMKKDADMEKSVGQIEIFDTGIAFLAGLMIVPAVFVFSGGDQAQLSAGPSLMFITLPKVFASMPLGGLIGSAFFLLVLFAALTSSISLMETVVSILQDKFQWSRRMACMIVIIGMLLIGIPTSLGFGIWDFIQPLGMSILDFFDFISNSVLMPIVAFLTCIFIGFVVKPDLVVEEVRLSSKFKREKLFRVMIKYVAPIFIVAILVSSVLNSLGIITI